jgi:hypothetical protein
MSGKPRQRRTDDPLAVLLAEDVRAAAAGTRVRRAYRPPADRARDPGTARSSPRRPSPARAALRASRSPAGGGTCSSAPCRSTPAVLLRPPASKPVRTSPFSRCGRPPQGCGAERRDDEHVVYRHLADRPRGPRHGRPSVRPTPVRQRFQHHLRARQTWYVQLCRARGAQAYSSGLPGTTRTMPTPSPHCRPRGAARACRSGSGAHRGGRRSSPGTWDRHPCRRQSLGERCRARGRRQRHDRAVA